MKIRSILTIKYAGITATIFLVFMATIYCVNEHLRSDSFYRSLRSEAITKAHLFLNNQVDVETMQSIYLNNRQFIDEVEVAVYTPDFRILYHDALHNDIIKETPGMIDEIVRKKEIDFRTGDYQGIGILYEFGGKNYVVTAAAYDRYGHINQVIMTRLLLLLSIGGLSVLVIVGYMLAKSSLAPIRSIVRKAEGITVTQIDERLPVKNEHDELGELALAFKVELLLKNTENHREYDKCDGDGACGAVCLSRCGHLCNTILNRISIECACNHVSKGCDNDQCK